MKRETFLKYGDLIINLRVQFLWKILFSKICSTKCGPLLQFLVMALVICFFFFSFLFFIRFSPRGPSFALLKTEGGTCPHPPVPHGSYATEIISTFVLLNYIYSQNTHFFSQNTHFTSKYTFFLPGQYTFI